MLSNHNSKNVLFETNLCQNKDAKINSLIKIIPISVLIILLSQGINSNGISIQEVLAQDNYKGKPFEETNLGKAEKKFWKFEEKMYKFGQKIKKGEKSNKEEGLFDSLGLFMNQFNEKYHELRNKTSETANTIIERL